MLKAILFDKDGTLLDFNRTWLGAYWRAAEIVASCSGDRLDPAAVLAAGGYVASTDTWQPDSVLAAGSNREIIHSWNALLPSPMSERDLDRIRQAFRIGDDDLIPAVDPIRPCLESLREAGYVLGIATMDTEAGANDTARALGICDLFGFICGADSGFGEKPDPGMVNAFAEKTGCEPRHVVMVGDSPRDIEMGQNAGAGLSVGVASGAHSEAELLTYSHHVLTDISGLPRYLADIPRAG